MCHRPNRLESQEQRQLYPAIHAIGPVRIGDAKPDRLQPCQNFPGKIVISMCIVRGIEDIDTIRIRTPPSQDATVPPHLKIEI